VFVVAAIRNLPGLLILDFAEKFDRVLHLDALCDARDARAAHRDEDAIGVSKWRSWYF